MYGTPFPNFLVCLFYLEQAHSHSYYISCKLTCFEQPCFSIEWPVLSKCVENSILLLRCLERPFTILEFKLMHWVTIIKQSGLAVVNSIIELTLWEQIYWDTNTQGSAISLSDFGFLVTERRNGMQERRR